MPSRQPGAVQYDNTGRVAIVTGGADGIGRAICERFYQTGASVVVIDDNEAGAKSLPDGVDFFLGDVTRRSDCQAAVAHAVDEYQGVDVLVNNAGIQPIEALVPVDKLDEEIWRRVLDVNVTGYTLMAQAVVPVMQRQQSGVIVNLASAHAHRTSREAPVYGPSKAANLMQAKQWGVEYARHGIRVVSVSPGAIDTPLVRARREKQGGGAELANRHPLGRIGRPEEVAAAVLWLSSPDASFITAADLQVDGGLGAFGAFADPYAME